MTSLQPGADASALPAPGGRILVVDDHADQMKALCHTLHDRGYEATGFTSPREALRALAPQRFDLLLTDLTMPELDGIGLLRAAREIDGDLVGVMMTGHATIDTAVEAMKVGALDYIIKPFNLNVLLPILSRALTIRRLRLDNAELVRRVRERTLELEAVNQELEAFSYSVAHDLRAPLRAISGFSNLIVQDFGASLPEEASRLLQRVIHGAREMSGLIDILLRLSRLGRQAITPDVVDFNALVKVQIEILEKETTGRRITWNVGDLSTVQGDAQMLKQVWVNLLSNAHKFTRDRDPAMIAVGSESAEGERIYFVKDNGAGFDMRYADRLFSVFQRLHSSDEFEGTGVGLSIVQRIVRRHGGRVWAEAEPGQGATFYFSLPLARAG